jgi:hypothetical protein
VRDEINDSPELAWDEVVWRIAANGTEEDDFGIPKMTPQGRF